MDAFARLSPALRYQVLNELGWDGLRPVQELSTHAILDGANCVVLAPTAGGKTEAAFLPLLSAMDTEDWHPLSVLYLAPIRALLNNQEARLHRLTGLVGRRAAKWHGDVGAAARKRILADLPDVLAITPESLEAMLLSPRDHARRVLERVRAVVVDEVHAFAGDDRGAHLVALLERISRIAEGDLQRIGLSATVGDPEEIAAWLGGSSMRGRRVVDPAGARKSPHLSVDFVGTLDNAARMVDELHPGTRRLVFVDSRRKVEELGHRLSQRGVDVYLSHSSLALSERTAAERAFAEGDNCVIVATSALELGLDVGDLDHVMQVDAPGTVASFLQRMGRTGRRAGTQANCTFLATDEAALLQAAALVELFGRGFVEPAAPSRWCPHILAHQLIALAMQERGVEAGAWWAWLDGCAAFNELGREARGAIATHMLHEGILVESDARLLLGERGERLYGARNFQELYAVFSSPRVLRVLHGTQEVGVVDASFLQDKDRGGPNFVLGGRPWRLLGIDWRSGQCAVEPAEDGSYPRWFGRPVLLSRVLCQAVRDLLVGTELHPSWTRRAAKVVAAEREKHSFLQDDASPLVDEADGKTRWWTFGGGSGNRAIAALLQAELGDRVSASNHAITFSGDAAKSDIAIRRAVGALRARHDLGWADVLPFAETGGRARVSKFQPCLPEAVEAELVARETMDVLDANLILAEWRAETDG